VKLQVIFSRCFSQNDLNVAFYVNISYLYSHFVIVTLPSDMFVCVSVCMCESECLCVTLVTSAVCVVIKLVKNFLFFILHNLN